MSQRKLGSPCVGISTALPRRRDTPRLVMRFQEPNGHPPLSFVETDTGRPMRVRVTADPAPETTSGNIEIRLNPAWRHS